MTHYIEDSFLVQDKNLRESLSEFYEIVSASRQSVYRKLIVSDDRSTAFLKTLIKEEAEALGKVTEMVGTGLSVKGVITALKSMYATFKRSITYDSEKPIFYHLNSLKKSTAFDEKVAVFYSKDLVLTPDGFMIGTTENAKVISLPLLSVMSNTMYVERGAEIYRIYFRDIGSAYIDNGDITGVRDDLTEIVIKYEIRG